MDVMDFVNTVLGDVFVIHIIFTPLAALVSLIYLVMIMITPSDTKAAEYKEYIKWVWIAWLCLALVPTFMAACYEWSQYEDMLTFTFPDPWGIK